MAHHPSIDIAGETHDRLIGVLVRRRICYRRVPQIVEPERPNARSRTSIWERQFAERHGQRLEYFMIGWNAVEGFVAVIAGLIAGSISLVRFGIDSFIEVTSGLVLLWRMSVDADVHHRDRNEKRAFAGCRHSFRDVGRLCEL
ncbi:MAG: hypothetical protein M3N22_04380 [Acidobacteriota bacterium]|nr:hypothetical protein [Acidobacteriota bacterium]